jgi:hypothetical protein
MKHRIPLLFIIAALLIFSVAAYGHHSLGATYQADAQIKLEGRLVQFVYRNPHSFVHIEAKGADGNVKRWAVEWTGAAALAGQGVQGNSLKPGDQVVIMGRPSRSPGETRALMLSLWRPSDDFRWGSRPNEVVD